MKPFVSATYVAEHLDDLVLCDVRWYLDGRSGLEAYARGHLPGAVFVDLDAVLAAPPSPRAGRHPLPDPEVFAAAMGALGIGNDDAVVAYDDASGTIAARLVWMLRALGSDAALLDGGLQAWPHGTSSAISDRAETRFRARPWPNEAIADSDAVLDAVRDPVRDAVRDAARGPTTLVDARAPERYRGEVEPVDARAGHIPGAVNVPVSDLLGDDGTLLEDRFVEDRLRRAGLSSDDDVIVSCGSGVTACFDLLAIEHVGIGATRRLYPGSFSQWAADGSRPVATGHLP